MNDETLQLCRPLLRSSSHLDAALNATQTHQKLLRAMISQRRLPPDGLPSTLVQSFLHQLSSLDANNFASHVGGGEREGRVYSSLVASRNFGLAHGVGRSGDVTADQPKAAGSSLLNQLTQFLALDALKVCGWKDSGPDMTAVVFPTATGMTLALLLRSLVRPVVEEVKRFRPSGVVELSPSSRHAANEQGIFPPSARGETSSREGEAQQKEGQFTAASSPQRVGKTKVCIDRSQRPSTARYVVWCRIDQKTSLKCVEAAGFVPVIVELRPVAPAAICTDDGGGVRNNSKRLSRKQQSRTAQANEGPVPVAHPPNDSVSNDTNAQETKLPSRTEDCTQKDASGSPSHCFLQSHIDDVAAAIKHVGREQVVCVMITTSCFAPRLPDDPLPFARLCDSLGVPLVVNNAYGTQCPWIMKRLATAMRLGRVDGVVQSCDKNFLTPVGGAIVAGPEIVVRRAAALYAGRASVAPTLDLFMTLCAMGRSGLESLHRDRLQVQQVLRDALRDFATARKEELLVHPANEVSVCVTMGSLTAPYSPPSAAAREEAVSNRPPGDETTSGSGTSTNIADELSTKLTTTTYNPFQKAQHIGAQLFRHAVTGPRVILPNQEQTLCGVRFQGYGCHSDDAVTVPMLVVACGVGMTMDEVHVLMKRLADVWPVSSSITAASASS